MAQVEKRGVLAAFQGQRDNHEITGLDPVLTAEDQAEAMEEEANQPVPHSILVALEFSIDIPKTVKGVEKHINCHPQRATEIPFVVGETEWEDAKELMYQELDDQYPTLGEFLRDAVARGDSTVFFYMWIAGTKTYPKTKPVAVTTPGSFTTWLGHTLDLPIRPAGIRIVMKKAKVVENIDQAVSLFTSA